MAARPKFREAFTSEIWDFILFFYIGCSQAAPCRSGLQAASYLCSKLGTEYRSQLMQTDREAKSMSMFFLFNVEFLGFIIF